MELQSLGRKHPCDGSKEQCQTLLHSRPGEIPASTGSWHPQNATTEHQEQATGAARASLATVLMGRTPDVPISCHPGQTRCDPTA